MSSDGVTDLRFDCVSKRYRIRREGRNSSGTLPLPRLLRAWTRPRTDFWALRDVSFEAHRGESLGIIGHNGAGKSTILKLIAGITAPTAGEITIRGRLAALIEVGSGFHPELTGRENIFLNGSILGMSRREIADKLDSIVDFAGVQPFIDVPVKQFSSGMYVRLGFSIAAHLDPDILLLDEVLAVGDAAFQSRCLERIDEMRAAGVTIVFISHDLGSVERICDRVILMDHGRIVDEGLPRHVIDGYQKIAAASQVTWDRPSVAAGTPNQVEFDGLAFHDASGAEATSVRTGEQLVARVSYRVHAEVEDAAFELLFYRPDSSQYVQCTTAISGGQIDLSQGPGAVEFVCPELALLPGTYYADLYVKHRGATESIDWQYQAAVLRVERGKSVLGSFYMPHCWRIQEPVNREPELQAQMESRNAHRLPHSPWPTRIERRSPEGS